MGALLFNDRQPVGPPSIFVTLGPLTMLQILSQGYICYWDFTVYILPNSRVRYLNIFQVFQYKCTEIKCFNTANLMKLSVSEQEEVGVNATCDT